MVPGPSVSCCSIARSSEILSLLDEVLNHIGCDIYRNKFTVGCDDARNKARIAILVTSRGKTEKSATDSVKVHRSALVVVCAASYGIILP